MAKYRFDFAKGPSCLLICSKANLHCVIIPTINEEMDLQRALDAVSLPSYSLEVIVVGAGSSDHTIEIAQRHGCKVFVGNPRRANQMNTAAAIAAGVT